MGFTRIPYHFTILPSAARTATTTSETFVNNEGFPGLRVFIDVTADPAAASVTFAVQVWDPVGGDWAALLTSAAQAAVLTAPVVLTIAPGVTDSANVAIGTYIGQRFRVVATAADADSLTYSVAGEWLPC